MNRILLLAVILSVSSWNVAQDIPTKAIEANAFGLGSDNLGTVANSVNLFTGDLSLPLNLVSIPGSNGLGINISIAYSSANIENVVDVWNLDAPTGVLGLGWSLSYPMILVENKSTGARDDDEFYLMEGGAATRLYCVANSSGVKSYKTETFTSWLIGYTASTEKWEIIKDDGTKYVYGDAASARNTVQWTLKWDNWIGDAKLWTNQRQGVIWNLSQVINVWGEKITYSYINDENTVGASTITQTEASYLTKVSDGLGREVELVYKNKTSEEYQDPHTELTEPDAYQERYEKKFLDKIITRNNGITYSEVYFKYSTNLLGTGNLTKRVLKSVTQMAPSGAQAPGMLFNYLTSGPMRGALFEVGNTLGGKVVFEYHSGLTLPQSKREKINSAAGGFDEATVTLQEDDYAVITRRQSSAGTHVDSEMPVNVFAYRWDGKWKESSLGSIGNVTMSQHNQDFKIASSKNFFAILKPIYGQTSYWLYLYHFDEKSVSWIKTSYQIDLGSHDGAKEQLFTGENFVVASNNNGKLFRYVFTGNGWTSTVVNETTGTHFTAAANNYIISHNTASNPDGITFYYLDENLNWIPKTIPNTFNNAAGDSYWYAANGFAVLMANAGNERIYRWSDTYNSFSYFDVGFGFPDYSTVFITGESQVTFISPNNENGQKIRALRLDGTSWKDSGDDYGFYVNYQTSVGQDIFLWQNDGTGPTKRTSVREFDPNISAWKPTVIYTNYNEDIGNPIETGNNAFWIYDKIYFRSTNGSWSEIGSLYHPEGKSLLNSFMVGTIHFVKNGTMGPVSDPPVSNFILRNRDENYDKYMYRFSPRTLVTASYYLLEKPDLAIHRIANYRVLGGIEDYPVKKVTTISESKSYVTSFDYNAATAVFDQGGTVAKYNKVTSIPGSSTVATKPFGYTESYFFNGLSEAELGDTFPFDTNLSTNAAQTYNVLTGQQYRTKVYNALGNTVSSNEKYWKVNYLPTQGSAFHQNLPLLVKDKNSIDGIETVQSFTYSSASPYQLQNLQIFASQGLWQSQGIMIMYRYAWQQYPFCASMNILTPIAQTWKTVNGGLTFTQGSVTRWKEWPCVGVNCQSSLVPAPVDKYIWKGPVATEFEWWDSSLDVTSMRWEFVSKTLSRDNTCGVETEVQSKNGMINTQLLDNTKLNVIASVSNAPMTKIGYTSFEDAVTGNWSYNDGTIVTGNSKTGNKYMSLGTTGLTKPGLVSSERYVISFWAKSSSGSVVIDGVGTINLGNVTQWKLYEYSVTNLSSLNIRKSGSIEVQIDEVRINPEKAEMVTYTYHPMFGVTSKTDINNQTSYTEYDEFGRLINVKNEDGDIVRNRKYSFIQK